MATKVMRTIQACTLRDGPGLHGAVIQGALVGVHETVVVDAFVDDGYVHIVGPNPPINTDGTYLRYGKPAWIEYAHLEDANADKSIFKLEVNWSDKTVRFV